MNLRGTRSPTLPLQRALRIMTAPKADGIPRPREVATGPGTGILRRLEAHEPTSRRRRAIVSLRIVRRLERRPAAADARLMIPTAPTWRPVYTLEEASAAARAHRNMPSRAPSEGVRLHRSGRPRSRGALGYNGYPEGTSRRTSATRSPQVSLKPERAGPAIREAMKARG